MLQEKSCSMLIKQIHDSLEKHVNNSLRAQDITMAQGHALLELFHTPGGQMPLKELERALHVAQSTAAGIVVRLEQKGLVESLGDPSDRRVKTVRITERGREFGAMANEHMDVTEVKLLSALTEAERGELLRLLEKTSQSLE